MKIVLESPKEWKISQTMEVIKQSFLNHQNKKVFVILCLHEDEPFLEGEQRKYPLNVVSNHVSFHSVYSKKVQAQAHNPTHLLDLKNCNYVGLKIPVRALGQQETYEFVVSLENCEVVTFSAKTWLVLNRYSFFLIAFHFLCFVRF